MQYGDFKCAVALWEGLFGEVRELWEGASSGPFSLIRCLGSHVFRSAGGDGTLDDNSLIGSVARPDNGAGTHRLTAPEPGFRTSSFDYATGGL